MYKLAAIASLAFFLFIIWIIYLANTGGESVFFDFVASIPHGDKLGHFCIFGFLTFVVTIGTKFKSFSIFGVRIYYGAAIVLVFALLEELSQIFFSTRSFDLIDMSADLLGILIATCLCFVIDRRFNKRLDDVV